MSENDWSFDPNHVFDVNDETYWAAVLSAIEEERNRRRLRPRLMRRRYARISKEMETM